MGAAPAPHSTSVEKSKKERRKTHKKESKLVSGEAEDDFGLSQPDAEGAEVGSLQPKKRKVPPAEATIPKESQSLEQQSKKSKRAIPKDQAKKELGTEEQQKSFLPGNDKGTVQLKTGKLKKKLSNAKLQEAKATASDIATAPLEKQADWLWASFKQSTKASDLEGEGLEASSLTSLGENEKLEKRIRMFLKEAPSNGPGPSAAEEHGSPAILVIAASAVVANNLGKELRGLSKTSRVAKLFAKHFKVGEQQKDLQRPVEAATGTPNRMVKLADLGSLKMGRLRLVILDVATDAKQRTILDVPETRTDLWQFFGSHLKVPLAAGEAKLALIDSNKVL